MKRRLVTILAIFLAGAVMNVAVACWFAMSRVAIMVRQFEPLGSTGAVAAWERLAPPEWPAVVPPSGIHERAPGREVTLLMADVGEGPGSALGISEFKFGWPMLTLRLTHVVDSGRPARQRGRIIGGWQIVGDEPALGATVSGALPYTPVMPGIIVNTIGYAVVVWLAVGSPLVLFRWSRLRRGLCPYCGYPAGESEVCTECGR